jgi:RHS repeat-associated protein
VISASGPVAQFRFSDAAGSSTIADSAGSYTATNHGITLAEPGPFGGSNSGLFGGEAYAALPGNPLSGASEFTAEAWVDWTGGASYEQPIFDFGSSTTNYMALTPSGGSSHHLRFEIHTSSGTATVESSKALTASEWKYVAVSETSSGTITLYLNGAESAQTTKATLFPSSLGTVSNDWLGKPQGSGTPLFNGHMSNVAFYTKALSAASLLEHYDAAEYPVNTALPTVSGTDLEGDTLTAAAGTWTGLATIKFEYQWERCEGSTCSLITGATKSTYKTVSEDVDHGIRLAVTATNSAGKGNAKSAITSLIEGKPANTTLPSLSGVAEVGRTLHVSSGTWRADPSPTYTYQWELCKEKKCSKISGATESKYKLLSSQAGETVRVTVTATNSVGSASAASAETGSIGKTSCTDEWIGASGGTWQTAANWSTGKVPGSSDYACIEAGESVQVSASGQVAGTIRDEGTLEVLSGAGLELSGKTSTSTVANLSDTGTLAVAGTLDVSGSFTGNGHGTITGAGKVVLLTGSTGAITPVTCSKFYVNGGATLVNDGTITMGSVGGKSSGQLTMTEGAKLENAGTFNLDSYPESCIEGSNRASIENGETGAAPAVTNTGTLNVNVGSANTATISTPLNNQGTLTTQTGTLNLTGGGTSNSGTWTADSATTIAFTSGAPSITGATWAGAGTISIAGATATATTITASTANISITSGSLTIPSGSTTTTGSLAIGSGGVLSSAGTLDVSGSFTGNGHGTITGAGKVVLLTGSTGAITPVTCSKFYVNGGATLVNDGTITMGSVGGKSSGQLTMTEGAKLENAGTFNLDSYPESCIEGSNRASIENGETGAAPAVTNTGTLNVNVGSANTATISTPLNNQGTLTTQTGTLNLTGGSSTEVISSGSWLAGGGHIGLTSGTFNLREGSAFEANAEGGVIIWFSTLQGGLEALPYASGTVTVQGHGEGGLAATLTVTGTVEIAQAGKSEWHNLCESLSGAGTFSCTWNTASGSYPDGSYELRAKLSSASPAESTTTTPITVLVDNTAPTGAVTAPAHEVGGYPTVSGTATDSGSGVASWQLRVAAHESSEWSNACPSQTAPASGSTYSCTLNATALHEGAYQLDAVVTDKAGNTFTTPAVAMQINNAKVSATLTTPPAYLSKTASLTGKATATGSSIASWTVQIATPESNTWSNACPTQTSPIHESEYGCTMTTTAFADGQYEMRVLALDTAGDSYTSTPLSATIDNTPPTGNLYQLPPSVAGSLEVSGYAYDAGSGVNTWTLERALVGSGEFKTACTMLTDPLIAFTYSCTISTTELTNGEYQFRAKIVDNAGNSYTTPVVSTTVANGTLSNTTAPTVSGETTSGSALTTSNGKWSGGGTITYRYQWERCNASGAECVAIESATAASYVLASADVGHTLRVTVTAANGAETKPATSTVTAAVTNPVLHDVTVPSVHGYAQVGAVLSAETGSWRGVPPIAYAYQWQRCSEGGTGCANISAATSQTYVPVQEDASHTLRVVVTATNSEGSSSAESALTKVVAAGTTTGIRYLYEEAGRLKLVDSPTEGAAVYSWDPNGNLLSIQRFAATTLSVLAATPKHAPSGAKVDLTGTDFDTNPAHDSVTFNEVSATIASVTPTDITVTVPSGFTSGTITVTVDGKSAKLGGTFEGDARRAEGRAAIATRSANTTHAAATQAAHAALATHATSSRSLQATLATYRSPYPSTWTPAARNTRFGDWFSERAPSPWTKLGPLSAPHGTTGLTGQVLDVDGTPLTHVTLSIEGFPGRTQTDSTGRFVLDGIPGGHQVLVIDGASANRTGADYGRFTAAVEVQAGKLTPLGYPVWLTPLDPAGDSTIESPLKHETALTNPSIPGLEVRLPAGTVVRSASGAAVRHVNLTAIPLDRTPFPLPPFITGVPTYFTVQPGGAYLNKGAQIVYPNWGHLPAGQRVDFWNYNPHDHGWYVYGKGTVSANGKQVVPDPGVRVWEFTGAMLSTGGTPPGEGPPAGSGAGGGDPVDDATGLFVWQHTDLSVPDANLPISLTQVYRPGDPTSYSFGIGTQSVYDIHIWGAENYRLAYVVLPDGGTVKLVRTSPGSGYTEAVYTAEGAPGYWQGTQLYWNTGAGGWVLRLKTGLKYYFPDYAPASSIEAPDGERVVLSREGGVDGRIREIRGPHNRSIFLNYDSSNRVIRATDSGGQTVHYEYNAAGLLARVTDALGHVTRYAYNSANEMTSVTNARGNVLVANTYNASGEVVSQTVGGKGTYTFKRTWPCGECKAKGTSILTTTNPVGEKRVIYFNDWLAASETFDPGPSAQWRDYQRGANGEVTKITSSEGTTAYTYNTAGYPTSETRYSATQAPLTTTRVYNEFGEPTSVTDPMGRTTVYRYDEHGNLISKTDPLGNTTTFGRGTDGELTSITNAEGQTTRYRYTNGERTGVTDPLGHEWEIGYNAAGDATSVRDPEGDVTKFAYDADNELLSETDGANDTTSYEYDADGDIIAITDPRKNVQKATYNALDQLESVTDALKRTTTYEHNAIGQLTAVTDPEGKTSTFAYDGLGRLEESAYGIVSKGKPTSTTSYSYNPENELSTVKDSRAGTFTFTYDGFHRLAGESGPNGSVAYTYNPDGQRETMSLNGTEEASYAYNAGGQLTAIKTPNGTTSFNLNANGQRTLTTLSNGDTESYGYDGDSRLSSVNYANSKGARIGDLELGRDALGRVTTESGSEARTTLPAALAEATYDADNEILTREGKKFTYNLDGDLTEDNLGTYSWNDRNQLTGVKQGANSWTYSYDPFGRRMSTTVGSTETSYLDAGLSPARETTSGQATQLLDGLGLNEVFARTSSTTSSLLDTAPGGSEAGTGAAFSPPGNTLALTNAEGATTTEYTYDPFGAATSSGTSSPNTVQYDGGEEEADGLEFDRARYYQPQTARFISNDPIGFDGSGINLYGFVHDDPTNLRDPLGLFPEKTYNPTETCEKDECSQLHELAEEEGEKVGGGPVNAAAPKGHGKEVEEDICTIKSIVKTIVDTPEGIVEIAKEVISASKC